MAFMFENLAVYQKAIDFTEQVVTLTGSFPRGFYFLADQLNRASLSIATNLAEGNGRFTKSDRRNFFIIARGSGIAYEFGPSFGLSISRVDPLPHQLEAVYDYLLKLHPPILDPAKLPWGQVMKVQHYAITLNDLRDSGPAGGTF